MKKYLKSVRTVVWGAVSVFLIIVLALLTVLENTMFKSILGTVLGGPTPIKSETSVEYYKSEYGSKQESKEAGDRLNVEIAEEGFTLLLNEKGSDGKYALPIKTPVSDSSVSAKPRVSVFGKNSVNLVLGGSGSGGISGEAAKTIYDGLDKGGFEYNPELRKFYESFASGDGRSDNPQLGLSLIHI